MTEPTLAELGEMLRRLRRREARNRGGPELTYRELAAKTGWSLGIVSEYFAGKALPPTDRFDALIRLLGATPAEQGKLATARDRLDEQRRKGPLAKSWYELGVVYDELRRTEKTYTEELQGFAQRQAPRLDQMRERLQSVSRNISNTIAAPVSGATQP